VSGKVKRSSAKIFPVSNYVEEDLPYADNSQSFKPLLNEISRYSARHHCPVPVL
jgi:hypothetical protein